MFILNEIRVQGKIYTLIGTLLGCHILLIIYLVPVLAPNYKQHILLPAKVRQLCYSLIELCAKCIYLNLFGWRGATFMKHFKDGASYKSLGTSGLCSSLN
jgi:hypothetical protein